MSTTSATRPRRQLCLPGQSATAEGPLDLSGMYLAHHAFRRDLARFAAAASATPVSDAEAWRALAVRWQRFSSVLHHHHTTEDAVLWPQLLELVDAAGNASARATLEAMEAEHDRIDPLLAACAAGFEAMAHTPDDATRDRLAGTAAETRDCLAAHLVHEETEALPLAQRHLSEAGWQRVEKAAGEGGSLADLFFLVPWAAAGLGGEDLERALTVFGRPFRVLLWVTRGRFERSEQIAFRHA
ncbi:hemerythrin domain-containing protein [Geodermatophilus sabuli]|uniref:Hemerythrin domain-containing protein n=1 Tax=Geodermatophilus sabuli TaxID=1564158 RepID=A0A7K3VY86_9ACTN|nr:hemerythrin domain-containing protein [Geodermatophilus sabuli]NEK57562.1 hemerythrin domain-containing protein [Geodermatophilus sabuli]